MIKLEEERLIQSHPLPTASIDRHYSKRLEKKEAPTIQTNQELAEGFPQELLGDSTIRLR